MQSRYYNPEIGRFINADDTENLGINGEVISYNLYTYCLNNPIGFTDSSGEFALSAFLGAVVGGAIGGALISGVSCVVSNVIAGRKMTDGIGNALLTGAVAGAAGAAIGAISVGGIAVGAVTLSAKAATLALKGVASIGVGIGVGLKVGIESGGTNSERAIKGVVAGVSSAGATFLGAQIDATTGLHFGSALFANYATTLFVGVPAEIVSASTNAVIDNRSNSKRVPWYYTPAIPWAVSG